EGVERRRGDVADGEVVADGFLEVTQRHALRVGASAHSIEVEAAKRILERAGAVDQKVSHSLLAGADANLVGVGEDHVAVFKLRENLLGEALTDRIGLRQDTSILLADRLDLGAEFLVEVARMDLVIADFGKAAAGNAAERVV